MVDYITNPNMPDVVMAKQNKNVKSLYYPLETSETPFMSFDIYSRVNVNTSKKHSITSDTDFYGEFAKWVNLLGVYPTATNKSGDYKSAICLYIPPGLKTEYNMQYTETETDLRGGLFAGESPTSSFLPSVATSITQAIEALGDSAGRIQKSFGIARNPFMEVLFQTPSFRTHTFDFKFNPITEQETEAVTNIIKEFKLSQHPDYSQKSGRTLFTYPDEFEISFLGGYQKHLFKINRSYLTNVAIDYNAEGIASFFERTSAPTAISMQLTFKETTILTKDDIENGY